MNIRRVVAAALSALLMLCVLGTVGAQQKVRFVLKDLDTDPSTDKFLALIEEPWRRRARRWISSS